MINFYLNHNVFSFLLSKQQMFDKKSDTLILCIRLYTRTDIQLYIRVVSLDHINMYRAI